MGDPFSARPVAHATPEAHASCQEAGRVQRAEWPAPLDAQDSPLSGVSERSYLALLDWTGRQIRADKPGRTPASLAPLLAQLDIDSAQRAEAWLERGRGSALWTNQALLSLGA